MKIFGVQSSQFLYGVSFSTNSPVISVQSHGLSNALLLFIVYLGREQRQWNHFEPQMSQMKLELLQTSSCHTVINLSILFHCFVQIQVIERCICWDSA